MEELHAEVHRITSCPYTPSLKVPEIKNGERKNLLRLPPFHERYVDDNRS